MSTRHRLLAFEAIDGALAALAAVESKRFLKIIRQALDVSWSHPDGCQPFTAPKVRPRMRGRWKKRTKRRTGISMIIAEAESSPQRICW